MNRRHTFWLLLAMVLAAFLAAPGCIFSPDDGGGDGGGGGGSVQYPLQDSPDNLMAKFQMAYDNMDIDAYRDVLHTGYKFVFAEGTQGMDPRGYWLREDELESATHMFSGEPFTNSQGEVAPGISDISFDVLDPLGVWEPVPENDPDFAGEGAMKRLYQVHIVLSHDGGTYTINSQQIFVVIPVEEDDGTGVLRTVWYLYGQQDLATGVGGKVLAAAGDGATARSGTDLEAVACNR